MRRLWLVLAWFVLLFAWNLSTGWWWVGWDLSGFPRLSLIALRMMATPLEIFISIVAIILIFVVNFKNNPVF